MERVTVLPDADDPRWAAAEQVEAQVFLERGYAPSAEELQGEYARYRPHTTLVVLEHDSEVVGMARLIGFSLRQGLKTVNDAMDGRLHISEQGWKSLDSIDPRGLLDVASLALSADCRRLPAGSANHLYRRIFGHAVRSGRPHVLAGFDTAQLAGVSRGFHAGIARLGEARSYQGAPSVVGHLDLRNFRQVPTTGECPLRQHDQHAP